MARPAAARLCAVFALLLVLLGALRADARTPRGPSSKLKSRLQSRWITNAELSEWMDEYIGRCGTIARKFTVGTSAGGRPFYGLEVSDKPNQSATSQSADDEREPSAVFIGNMHGDEISGRNVIALYAEWLCSNWPNGDSRAASIVRGTHTYLVPTMNPDGFEWRQRENLNGRDLNRDFPDQYVNAGADLSQPRQGAEPETVAVMTFLKSRPFSLGANFHEGALVANYPLDARDFRDPSWSYGDPAPSADDASLLRLASLYATAPGNGKMAASKEFPGGVTNGAAWYDVYGGMQDWAYLVAGQMHLTLEISPSKSPARGKIPSLWAANRDAVAALSLATLGGLQGVVTSAGDGAPVGGATVRVKAPAGFVGVGAPDGVPFKTGLNGHYARPLAPGRTYSVTFAAPGFVSQERSVALPASGGAVLNITLARAR